MSQQQPPPSSSPGVSRSLRTVGLCALLALSAGLVTVVLAEGFSSSGTVKALEQLAIGLLVVSVLVGAAAAVAVRMAGWRDPESEQEFEALVQRAEALAHMMPLEPPAEREPGVLDPLDDEDFAELVREALDDLPELLRNALGHVAVMVSDDGARHRAYGLYQGDGAKRDDYPDRIVIFRDTLRRDFGHDADMLRGQITRTVRHELAHHVGFDELGVSRLDL